VSSTTTALKGRRVRFHVRDVHVPEPTVVLQQLHADEVLEGEVIDTTGSPSGSGVFVVIEVGQLPQPVILAAERILGPRDTSRQRGGE